MHQFDEQVDPQFWLRKKDRKCQFGQGRHAHNCASTLEQIETQVSRIAAALCSRPGVKPWQSAWSSKLGASGCLSGMASQPCKCTLDGTEVPGKQNRPLPLTTYHHYV
jgi:hypothetical protein